jgi:putative aldouronate transport system permease protein
MTANMDKIPAEVLNKTDMPQDSFKMAMVVIAAGPMMLVFPFFQKYFVRGIAIGAVKG